MMDRPNILVIMTDQQRRDTLGAYGCDWIATPNLDRLAAEGTLFTACTVDNPICTPSRASIFTGKSIPGHSVYRVHDNLPDDEVLFTAHLQQAGYHTALFGKLHVSSRLREEEQRHPHDGFDIYEWCLEPSVGMDSPFNGYVRWLAEQAPDFLERLHRNRRAELHHAEEVHMSKWAADRTIDFIENADSERPFFCLMSLFDPHDPYEDHPLSSRDLVDAARIPRPLPQRSTAWAVERERHGSYVGDAEAFTAEDIEEIRLGYGASIAFADRQIGRVLAALAALGQAENTCVIFLSDHGDQLGDHGLFVKGAGLYEPTVGVPLIVRWSGHVAAGGRCGALVQGHDLAATCLAAAGLDARALCPESENLAAVAATGHTRRRAAICAYRNSGIDNTGRFWEPPLLATMARNERYKLIVYSAPDGAERELFDLATDPDEQVNLSGRAEVAMIERALLAEITAFLHRETGHVTPRTPPSIPSAAHRLKNSLK
jgi:arylsulfatase A-like enzyme